METRAQESGSSAPLTRVTAHGLTRHGQGLTQPSLTELSLTQLAQADRVSDTGCQVQVPRCEDRRADSISKF